MGVFAVIGLLLVLGGLAMKNRKLVIGGLIVMGIGMAARFHRWGGPQGWIEEASPMSAAIDRPVTPIT